MYSIKVWMEDSWVYLTDRNFEVEVWKDFDKADKVAKSWRLPDKYHFVQVVPSVSSTCELVDLT
jgi:hypothetical protein